ncbi:gas vesicle protein [Gracilibacillus salitolerans]|uniref:Gas vesicle protein n=1 Tax=Gracilibacillus salitolerans TaxID=2663022 RepID=A0A5Q2TP56_9BACI|nr:gas vesicle protein [Gracilibacillus salitolerans]QGH36774.1 gas vesicle protein [Gracilibacillus salitolerans]
MPIKESVENKDIALIDILDVILDKGIAIKGDLIISIAGVDLVYLDLRVLISSVEKLVQSRENDSSVISSQQFDSQRRDLSHATSESERWSD